MKHPVLQKKKKLWGLQRNKKVYLYAGIKAINKTLLVEVQTLDVADEDNKSAVLNMSKDPKEIISKERKDKWEVSLR